MFGHDTTGNSKIVHVDCHLASMHGGEIGNLVPHVVEGTETENGTDGAAGCHTIFESQQVGEDGCHIRSALHHAVKEPIHAPLRRGVEIVLHIHRTDLGRFDMRRRIVNVGAPLNGAEQKSWRFDARQEALRPLVK